MIPTIHLSVPILFIFLFTFVGLRGSDINLVLAFIVGFVIFSAPHIFWTIAQKYAKPSKWVNHAGYAGASLALFIICCSPPDSSGILNQWLAYWRLAALLIIIFVSVTFVVESRRAS